MDTILDPVTIVQGDDEMRLSGVTITQEIVKKALSKLRSDKATGVDEISPRLLMEASYNIVEPLCNIFNSTVADCVVPDDWHRANVIPAHKKEEEHVQSTTDQLVSPARSVSCLKM